MTLFRTVLVANRGEIAVRIIRTLDRLGIDSVAVYSDADTDARHVAAARRARRLGPAPAAQSYLDIGRIIDAAVATGAEAIHPGYGFLAENAAFARACEAAGIVFIGPSPAAIETMGDKIRAKAAVSAAGVPVVPGRAEPGLTDTDLAAAADEVGYPVLVKPSAGGGGKGMRLVTDPADLAAALVGARREAAASFGDDTLFLERFVTTPRHIEVQVLADTAGATVHLGERECSLQRRHQKVVEEAPSALLDPATRERIGASACATAASVGYRGAGTVEFIVSALRPEEFFFMEMNTRLQVEHPVTEAVTGIDLVEAQLRVAAGEPLGFTQDDVVLTGHAVEARVYAEDPARGFVPTGGRVLVLGEPAGPGVRTDSGLRQGTEVGSTYDPMLAKVVAWAPDRAGALDRLDRALADTLVLGVGTNLAFLRALVTHPDVLAGRLDTGLIERDLDALVAQRPSRAVYAAWALTRLRAWWPAGPVVDPWAVPSGWRVGGPRPLDFTLRVGDSGPVAVTVTGTPGAALVGVDGAEAVAAALVPTDGDRSAGLLSLDGETMTVHTATAGAVTWIALGGTTWAVTEVAATRRGGRAGAAEADVRSPMPGRVVAVEVATGDTVAAGAVLLVLEAMKMEYRLSAPGPGVVEVFVGPGDQVVVDQVLARVDGTPEQAPPPPGPGAGT